MSAPTSIPRSSILLSVAMVAGASAAIAEEEPVTDQGLTPVVVQGEVYRNTATKSALEPEETPGSVDVIDREAIETRGGDSVSEALRYTPGVTPELRGGAVTRLDQYSIRGFQDARTAYDGLLLLNNGWNLVPQIDPWAIEAIEVFKGPASVLYGNQPPGGLVNLIAKQPDASRYNDVRLEVGTRNLLETKGEFTGTVGSLPLTYNVVALGRQRDGQAVTSEEERFLFVPSVNWQLSEDTLVNLNLYLQRDPSAGIYNAIPAKGTVYDNPNGRLDPDFYAGDANYNTFDRDILMPGYKIAHQFNDRWNFLQNARFLDGSVYQENTYNTGLAADNRTLGRRAYLTDEESDGITLDNQLSGRVDWGQAEHNLLVGVDYLQLDSSILYKDAATVPLDLFNPNSRAIDPRNLAFNSPFAFGADFDLEYEQTGVYLQDQVRTGNWVLLGGGRYDWYESREEGNKYGAAIDDHFKQSDFTGRVGALYELRNGFAPYLSYSQSFEPLAGSNRRGERFDPAEAAQWETGIKFTSADRRHTATLAGFTITKENDITRDPNGGPNDLIQAGETRSEGVEINLTTQPVDNLTIALSGTLLDVEITKDNSGLEGKTPVWVAEEMAALWVAYRFSEGAIAGTELGAGVRYTGETQLDALNTDTVSGHTLVDMNLLYDLGRLTSSLDGFTASLTATNLFDERFYSCYDANNCWFGEEHTVKAGLRYNF